MVNAYFPFALSLAVFVVSANGDCKFYKKKDWQGYSLPLVVEANDDKVYLWPLWDDRISSLAVSGGCEAVLYEHKDWSGARKVFSSSTGDLGWFDNRATGLWCRCGEGCKFYQKKDWKRGDSMVLRANYERVNLRDWSWNDRISSLSVWGGCKAVLYEHKDWNGYRKVYSSSTGDLGWFDDRATGLWCPCNAGCKFYQQKDWKGNRIVLEANDEIANLSPSWNDKTSSLAVWGGCEAVLYEYNNWQGYKKVYSSNTRELGWFDDRATGLWCDC